MVRVAAIQMSVGDSMEENFQRSLAFMKQAAAEGAKILLFPEGHLSHYVAQFPKDAGVPGTADDEYAISLDHPYIRAYQEESKRLAVMTCVTAALRMQDGKVYAASILISETGKILAVGKKNHITTCPHFYEQDYFTPGDTGFQVVDTAYGRIGLIVCYDRHYPESYRDCVLKGADLILIPVGNEKAEPLDMYEWEIRVAAFQSSVNIVMCNRTGREGQMDFSGRSLIANAKGSAVAGADDTEQILLADLDLEHTQSIRDAARYMKLRRPEVFQLG